MKLMEIYRDMNELATATKPIFGQGMFHVVYPSKKFPDRVYKIGKDEDVNRWYDTFVNNPSYFPQVYKRGIINVKTKTGEMVPAAYVMIEKLNTVKFKALWGVMDKISRDEEGMPLQLRVSSYSGSPIYWERMLYYIKDDKELTRLFNEFYMLIDGVYEVFPSADLHKLQFGYDKNGVLKCLDI